MKKSTNVLSMIISHINTLGFVHEMELILNQFETNLKRIRSQFEANVKSVWSER